MKFAPLSSLRAVSSNKPFGFCFWSIFNCLVGKVELLLKSLFFFFLLWHEFPPSAVPPGAACRPSTAHCFLSLPSMPCEQLPVALPLASLHFSYLPTVINAPLCIYHTLAMRKETALCHQYLLQDITIYSHQPVCTVRSCCLFLVLFYNSQLEPSPLETEAAHSFSSCCTPAEWRMCCSISCIAFFCNSLTMQ